MCPDPQHLAALATLFDRTFILCTGAQKMLRDNCRRHRSGFWSTAMQVEVFDAEALDRALVRELGVRGASLLGLANNDGAPRTNWQHAVLTLLAHVELVRIAARRKLHSVMIMEADVRPLGGRSTLSPHELRVLQKRLRAPWSVVRAGGFYRSFATWYRDKPSKCAAACRCVALEGSKHLCEIMAASRTSSEGEAGGMRFEQVPGNGEVCDVRDTVAYAVSKDAFPIFLQARSHALSALANASVAIATARRNSTLGVRPDHLGIALVLPWFDVWLPAALDAIHVVPSLAVQQTKQPSFVTSANFAAHCFLERHAIRQDQIHQSQS